MSCSAESCNKKYLYFLTLFVFTDKPLSYKNTEIANLSAQKLGSGV